MGLPLIATQNIRMFQFLPRLILTCLNKLNIPNDELDKRVNLRQVIKNVYFYLFVSHR